MFAVHKFSWVFSESKGIKKYNQLVEALRAVGLGDAIVRKSSVDGSGFGQIYTVARYDPPWTLPWNRRNEIWVELNMETIFIFFSFPDCLNLEYSSALDNEGHLCMESKTFF